MRKVIVTDLTRFSYDEEVCTAVIDVNTGECFRPRPYLKTARCRELNMHPGAILEGKLSIIPTASNPHIEDSHFSDLTFLGAATAEEFKSVLDQTLSQSVSNGFGYDFADQQKHIPAGEEASCSIITIKVRPDQMAIHEDMYKPGKIRASFTDKCGRSYRYLSITDRGFFDYAKQHQDDGKLDEVHHFVRSQEEIYLRIGVGREWEVNGKNGYWLQVNGIYTFPNYLQEIRSYV